MHVALVGPCSPVDVVDLLDGQDAVEAMHVPGYRGIPVSELSKGLVAAGHQVTVITTDAALPMAAIEFSGPKFQMIIQRSRPRPRDYLRDLYTAERRAMGEALREATPDIVHAHWTYEFELAAQDSGLAHVTTARDAPWTILRHVPDAYRLARLGVAWRARPGIRHLVVASPYMADAWQRQMLYRREVTVIPNMAPTLPVVSGQKRGSPTAICVADASPRKNVDLLVRAFRVVRGTIPDARLQLVGFGLGQGDQLPLRLVADGVADGIEFIGHIGRPALASMIASAWCLVHPSVEESFGNTLVEAMMLGTPVIGGRDSGAVPWVLDHGRAGELVDVRSEAEVGQALVRYLHPGPIAPPARAQELLDTRYSSERVVQRHLYEYERVIGVSQGLSRGWGQR